MLGKESRVWQVSLGCSYSVSVLPLDSCGEAHSIAEKKKPLCNLNKHCRFTSILGLCSPRFWCGLEKISADTFPFPRVVLALCSIFSYVLPVLLLRLQNAKVHILDTESFESTFGPKSQRKRPNLFASDMQSLLENAEMSTESYDQGKDRDLVTEDTGVRYAFDPCCCASYRMSSLSPSCCCGVWWWRSQVVSSD